MFSTSYIFSLCFCALAISSGGNTVKEYVDLIELNHFYDHQGRHVYDQVIFYEHSPETGKFQVRAWCLVEDRETLNRRPIRNFESQLYQVDWFDTDQRITRRIVSRLYRESWTQLDPERANKKNHDERARIALVQNPKKFLASQQSEEAVSIAAPAASVATTEQTLTPTASPPLANTPVLVAR